jgi:hypothetical protein
MTDAISSSRSPSSLRSLAKTAGRYFTPCLIIQWVTILIIFLYTQSVSAQNMWMWNQRTHPELKWQTLETEHFNIHFHQGIETIARKGAAVAEQAYEPIMSQLGLRDFGKTDIVFSAEDEIMNGFAMPSDQIFIWVSQNDVAGHFSGSDKWLEMVVTHEFQHVAQFQAHRTWAGILGGVSIPLWWYEGMAEYMTEVWRVGRSDLQMKVHTYRNTMDALDPHDNGYAKVLYLASKYGDSTLVNISSHRLFLDSAHKRYPYWYDFSTAFKAETGQTPAQFHEEWRRVMNTYYYGLKAQKEQVEEVGESFSIKGFASIQAAVLGSDSTRVVVIGRRNKKMRDNGLYVIDQGPPETISERHHGRFSGSPALSPDGNQVIVSELHRGAHGSLLYDLRLVSATTGRSRWLTIDLRSHHPVFSSDGLGVFFVAHPGETSQIHYLEIDSGRRIQISEFEGDVQIRDLTLDHQGKTLLFTIQEESGDVNIALMNIDGTGFKKITNDPQEDLFPVWTQTDDQVVFTSYRNGTPNLFRVDLDSLKIVQMTDVAGGIFSRQSMPHSNQVLAFTMNDVDTVRLVAVDADRIAPVLPLNIRKPYIAWRGKRPDIPMPEFIMDPTLIPEPAEPYRAIKHLRPLARVFWPDVKGVFGMALFNDALGKHLIQAAGALNWDGSLAGGYLSYMNLTFKPAIHFYASQDMAFNMRRSFDRRFFELRNGVGMAAELPMNNGDNLYSNHTLRVEVHALERVLESRPVLYGPVGSRMMERWSKEFKTGITYIWKSQRPHADQFILPKDGLGLLAHAESSLPQVFGDNDYAQVWLDGFVNVKIPKTPLIGYSRLKWIKQEGDILEQDVIGFSETSSLYFNSAYWSTLRSTGLLDAPESYSLRGQRGHYQASELIYSVSELRLSVLSKIPLNILGVSIQNLTAAGFYDFGYLPETEIDLSTSGFELKFDVSIMAQSLFTMAIGFGGDKDYWKTWPEDPEPYLRMALVNPF